VPSAADPASPGKAAKASKPGGGGHTCVVCPYHGWAFSGDGVLREVPSSSDQVTGNDGRGCVFGAFGEKGAGGCSNACLHGAWVCLHCIYPFTVLHAQYTKPCRGVAGLNSCVASRLGVNLTL
jgi:hypothetical protein